MIKTNLKYYVLFGIALGLALVAILFQKLLLGPSSKEVSMPVLKEKIKPGLTPGTEWMAKLNKRENIDRFMLYIHFPSGGVHIRSNASLDSNMEETTKIIKDAYYLDQPYELPLTAVLDVAFKNHEIIHIRCNVDNARKIIYGEHWQSPQLYEWVMKKW